MAIDRIGNFILKTAPFNPYLVKYFNTVQDELKSIFANPPYNIPESQLNDLVYDFFTNQYRNLTQIQTIIESSFASKLSEKNCALKLIDSQFKKFYLNFNTKYDFNSKIKTFEEYINENTNDGFNAFLVFLNILSNLNLNFNIKNKNYLNTDNFSLFFYTNTVPDNNLFKYELSIKNSLINTSKIFNEIYSNKNLAVFFAIENYILKFGFYDVDNHQYYQTGNCTINNNLLKKFIKFNCTQNIYNIIENIKLSNLKLLHIIKNDLNQLLNSDSAFIINDNLIVKTVKTSSFTNPNDTTYTQYLNFFINWCNGFKWCLSVNPYIDIQNDTIKFYIKLK
jgi:uncharacterized protein YutD